MERFHEFSSRPFGWIELVEVHVESCEGEDVPDNLEVSGSCLYGAPGESEIIPDCSLKSVEAKSISAMFSNHIFWADEISFGLAHLLPVWVQSMSMHQYRLVGCLVEHSHAGTSRRVIGVPE